jgi:hypothetical protein
LKFTFADVRFGSKADIVRSNAACSAQWQPAATATNVQPVDLVF